MKYWVQINPKEHPPAEKGEVIKRISHYSFGSITVDGKSYRSDVIIYPDRVNGSWWRKEGHYLRPEDLEEVVASKPTTVVIGTGASGVMQVPEKTLKWLKAKGIEVHVARTTEAVEIYNGLEDNTTAVAALHLTC
jgi:hypothetical protein